MTHALSPLFIATALTTWLATDDILLSATPQYALPPAAQRNSLTTLVVFIGLALVLIGDYFLLVPLLFAPKPPEGSMNTEENVTIHVVRYMHWTEVNGQMSGSWSIAEARGNEKPFYGSGDLTGLQNGTALSLTAHEVPGTPAYTDTGTLDGNTSRYKHRCPKGRSAHSFSQGVSQEQYNQGSQRV